MNGTQAAMRPIDQIRCELNAEFRTGAEIAERLGMAHQVVGGPLGALRRHGEAVGIIGPHGESLWRKASGDERNATRFSRPTHDLGEDRKVGGQSDPIQPANAERSFVLGSP